jgi:two-component system NtrC family sensor kinase
MNRKTGSFFGNAPFDHGSSARLATPTPMVKRFFKQFRKLTSNGMINSSIRFRSSIYGRVVLIITGSLVVLFILFNLVFRTMYNDLFDVTIKQTGDHVSSIAEGALYYSMLENDKATLQRELDIIGNMSGIDEVNMYNEHDQLAYTSITTQVEDTRNPNCAECHSNIAGMFTMDEKNYRVVEDHPECGIFQDGQSDRHLLIRKPILNEPSCYMASCHAHQESEEVLGSLIINIPLGNLDMFVGRSFRDFLLLAMLIVGFMVTFLILFTRNRIKNPLNSIIRASEAVSRGDTSIRLPLEQNLLDDMRMVSLAFNNMLDNIEEVTEELQNWSQQLEYKVQKKSEALSEVQNELIHVERIASLGKLSSSVAHEINNPLSGILVYARLLHKQMDHPDFQHPKKDTMLKNLTLIQNETKRCGDIVRGLLDFSRKDREDFEETSLHRILQETHALMNHTVTISDITFRKEFKAAKDTVFCSPNQIKQACVALIVNATEAIRENGEITLRTLNPDDEHVSIEVADTGTGIADQDLQHIFEPFYSTKRETSGIGLGLAIVHGIVENHKGRIRVDSRIGQGTVFTITIPIAGN